MAQRWLPSRRLLSVREGERGGRLWDWGDRPSDCLCLRLSGALSSLIMAGSPTARFQAIAQSVAALRSTAEPTQAGQNVVAWLSVMVSGARGLRPRSARIDDANEAHHPFVFVTEDVAVKDKFTRNVSAEMHQHAHTAWRHRLVW